MNDVAGWIIGTAFLWIVTYICVNPIARHIATSRLRKTREPSDERKIDPQSIPDRYFMFSGALIFTILGFLIGLLFGTYFIGLSWKKRHLPGVAALILASLAGFTFFNAPEAYGIPLFLLILAALTPIVTGAAVMLQSPQILRWEREVPVTRPQARARPQVQPRACPSCGNINRLGDRFCRRCGTPLPAVLREEKAACTKCGIELKKGAKFCHICGQAATRARNICDICGEPLKHGVGYLLHGKLVAKANYMTEHTRREALAFGMPPEEMQTNLMAKARVDTTPWMACNKCIAHFLDTEEEKAQAHDLAKRFWQGEKIPLYILPTTSSLLEKAKKPEAQKKTMVCRKCGKEVEYDENLTACPHCMTYDPGWVMVMPGTKDARAQKHKEKAGDYYSQGEKRQAISEFKKAAEIDPTDPTIFNNIGAIYGELGDYDEALKYLRKALEIDPDLGPAKRQLKRIQEIVDK